MLLREPAGKPHPLGTPTDPMMPFGTGTVGGSRHAPDQSLLAEGLGPTQTKPAIFDADMVAAEAGGAKRC